MEIPHRERINKAKAAFSTRRVPRDHIKTLLSDEQAPKAGDLVLARVTGIGSHKNIELPTGRKASLVVGDEIIVAYGTRYAPDQYEAYVPDSLEPCHLVAAGGVAATAARWHARLSGPTEIKPIGLLGRANGSVINLRDHAVDINRSRPPALVFAVFGTSMNAGKTTTAAGIVRGLSRAGHNVGVAKITGTGSGGDLWMMRDFGAVAALDFTDAGYTSTFGVAPERIVDASCNLMRHLTQAGCNVAVLEIADGLYQAETAAIAASERLQSLLTGVFFAAGDAMGAASGAQRLVDLGHNLIGMSGAFTQSPLAIHEAVAACGVPAYRLADLTDPDIASSWVPERPSAGLAGSAVGA